MEINLSRWEQFFHHKNSTVLQVVVVRRDQSTGNKNVTMILSARLMK